MIKNKKADFTGVLYLIVSITAFAFFLLIAGYISKEISTEMKEKINSSRSEINTAFDATTNVATGTLSAVWYVMFGGLLIGLVITAWYMPTKPIFVPIFIILLVVTIIVGVALSNAYEKLYGFETMSEIADTQSSINFIMSNLPYVGFIIGVIALIVTFAKPKSDGGTPLM